MGLRYRLKGSRAWTDDIGVQTPEKIIELYNRGFAGAWYDPEARARLWQNIQARGGHRSGEDAMTAAGLADSGAGKLCLSFLAPAVLFPHCYPGCAQEIGDCVSHGMSGASLITFANEIWRALPDEVANVIEGVPDVPTAGIQDDVFSSEWPYWWRGFNGDGWDCAEAVDVTLQHGTMLRKPYPELGIDLTNYSGGLAHKYGSKSPPSNLDAAGQAHKIRLATEGDSAEATRDLIWNGYGIIDCGGEAWTESTDENGVAKRAGSWSHSMKNGAFDDRAETIKIYGQPLLLIINNWGVWNSNTYRDIRDSARYVPASQKAKWIELDLVNPTTGNILRPQGSFWVKWSEAKNRQRIAMSGANGWEGKDDNFLVV